MVFFYNDISNEFLWVGNYSIDCGGLSLHRAVDSYDVSFLGNIYCILHPSSVFVI